MAIESCNEGIESLERLVRETAGGLRRARRLADRVLRELTSITQAHVTPIFDRQAEEEVADSDAESGWRLAA